VVALFVSESPLPAYQDWRAKHPSPPWQAAPAKPELVLWDDGQMFHTLKAGSDVRGSKQSPEIAPLARLVEWLRAQGSGQVQAVGFSVQ
jgi:hypothetical protein